MRIISEFIDRHFFTLYGLVIFLIRLPPFHIFFIESSLLNSYNVAGYLTALLIFWKVSKGVKTSNKIFKFSPVLLSILIFFVSQSLSVINAMNIREFVSTYKDLVFAILAFVLTVMSIDSKEKLNKAINIIFFTILANIAIEIIMYFELPLYGVLTFLFTEGYIEDFNINSSRSRFFVDSYEAALVPLIFVLFSKAKVMKKKVGLVASGLAITFLSFLSNFRAQLVVLFISIFVGSKLYFKRVGDWVRFLTIIAIIFYFTNIITSIGLGYNALDRLIQPDQSDYLTIKDRFYYWNLAVEMGLSKPLFGVGLGNFFDYIPGNKNVNLSLFDYQNNFFKITWVHPHNLFFGVIAETGFVGLLALLTMLLFFAYEDYRAVKKHKDRTLNLLVVSFWFVFLFSLINAPISLAYLGLFWVLRGLITAYTTNKIVS